MAREDLERGRNASIISAPDNSALVQETGHAAQQADHNMSKWDAIQDNPINFLWCIYGIWALIVIGFDNQAGGIVISIPEFRKDYGKAFGGEYVIDAQWQSAFSGGPVASWVLSSRITTTDS
jgi:SP family general alpha glucoside:H+ symporter-like MFS transporter